MMEQGMQEIFENRIRVIKGEKGRGSRGGMVEVDGFTTFHGSVKELTERIKRTFRIIGIYSYYPRIIVVDMRNGMI